MSQPTTPSQSVIPAWVDSSLLQGMLRGIERESYVCKVMGSYHKSYIQRH